MGPHRDAPGVSFPRTWLALMTGLVVGLAWPALAPHSSGPVAPSMAAPAAVQAEPGDSDQQAPDEDDDSLPYNDDEPDEA